jgi:hydrogenase maturation protein HypF
LGRREASLLVAIITRGMNTPTTSSVGRLFDAVAALALGIDAVSYEGEAAVALEAAADEAETAGYDLPLRTAMDWAGPVGTNCDVGDWRPMLAAILKDVKADVEPGIIAGRFHDALANWALAVAERHPGLPIVLSGGCFQNRLLSERVQVRLRERGRSVYVHTGVPPGDGGLAVGQLAVARAVLARRRV